MFHNVQGEYRAVIILKWFATEPCIQLICICMPWDERWQKSHSLSCQKCQKSHYFCVRILARISGSRKVYEVFHVCSTGCVGEGDGGWAGVPDGVVLLGYNVKL